MKKEELLGLGISEELVPQVMALNGKDIEREKAKFADYAEIKTALEKANKTIESFGDVEAIKAEVIKYKAEAETAKTETAKKIHELETKAKIKDFTNGKKFVNEITREALENKLLEKMNSDEAKGKSLEDLFKAEVEGKENIIVDDKAPKPPLVTQMSGNEKGLSGVELAFQKMNPQIKV